MKTPSELDHYEVLEVGRDADAEEVQRAYRMLLATFGEDSLATYSIFDEDEAAVMQERIEVAYRVLGDPEARAEYDEALGGPAVEAPVPETLDPDVVEIALALEPEAVETTRPTELVTTVAFEDPIEEEGAAWGGPRLRRNRLERGIELAEIAKVTKVSPTYLRFIEDENFAGLPAPVYVRGFVAAYARCIGLDPTHIVPDYIERVESARGDAPSGGLFTSGRRRG